MAPEICRICEAPVPHGRKLCDSCKPTCLVCGERVGGRGRTNICTDCAQAWKWCGECREVKALDAFRAPSGRTYGYCWSCHLRKEKARRSTPEMRRYHYLYHLQRKFGLTRDEAERLEAIRSCAVCGLTATSYDDARKQLKVDHCHTEGRIRGVICGRCNFALSVLEADASWLDALARYLKT